MQNNSAKPRNFNLMSVPGLSDEARKAVNAAFDAMSAWRVEMANSNEKNSEEVIEKMAAAARALGWPEQIVDATRAQLQSITKMQIQMMDQSPCCRFHPAEVKVSHQPDFGTPCCLRPSVAGSALGFTHFRGHFRVHFRYGPMTPDLPRGDLVDRLQSLGFPPLRYPNYGAPDSCPGRFVSF
jgi:hypothetical protein